MIVSSTHGSGARGFVTAGVGTTDEPAARGTSDRAAVPSEVSTGIYKNLEMRDGDKSKLLDEDILKTAVNIVDIIAHKLLGMDVWQQPEIDKLLVETPDGSKNEWCWSRANFSVRRVKCVFSRTSRSSQASPQTSS